MIYDVYGNEIGGGSSRTPNVNVADSVAFVGSPITIFENDDSTAISGVDDGLLNAVSVVKISDSMYYMYYEGFSGGANYSNISLCFAYSTDGEHFTKGFPSGVTAPIAETNRLLPKGSTHGQCVVLVPDEVNSFRMVTIKGTDANRIAQLWKSPDGINWTLHRQISDGYNDSFVSVIVRGNLLKIFVRNRQGEVRTIGVITTDLEGNRHDESYVLEILSESSTQQLYQASASILDDHRELLLPTIYNPNTSVETVAAMILNNQSAEYKTLNVSAVIPSDVKSIYFGSGLVNIGLKTYAYYSTRDSDHEHFVLGTTKSAIKRIEVNVSI